MTRSFAEVDGVETTLIMAQRERAVSTVKRMIGDEAERREKGQEELKRKENRRAVRRLRLRASSAQRFSSKDIIYLYPGTGHPAVACTHKLAGLSVVKGDYHRLERPPSLGDRM